MSSRPGATEGSFRDGADVALDRYRALVDAIDDGIYQLDADGRFVAVNDVLVEATGYARDDLLGAHLSRVLAEGDVRRVDDAVSSVVGSDDDVASVDVAVRTADGVAVPCELRVAPLVEDGEFRGSVGLVRGFAGTHSEARTATPPDDLLATVLDEVPVGAFVLDEEFRVVWADETVCEYFGIDRDRIVGRDKRAAVLETMAGAVENPDRFAERVQATYDDDTSLETFECHVTAGDGREERWLEHRSRPIVSGRYAGGRMELYEEITDRKESLEARRETEERFQSLADAVEEYAIFRLDSEGYVASWNEGARAIKGYDAEEIVGEHFSTFYTDEDRASGVPERNLAQATETGSVEDEGWRVRKDGSTFWGNVTITAVRGEDGAHRGYLKVTRDMTDRHRRERELESELQRILGRISDAFYAVDENFRFTHVNERAEELLQHSEAELLGNAIWDVFPDVSETDEVREAFRTAMDSQEADDLEFYHDALGMWIEANLYPSETGISVYFRDVTDRREYERKLEESNERLEQFAYAASHDLQEPLRMVSSYMQLIEQRYADRLDEEGREFLEFAVDGADRMRDMIDGLLSYARVESRGEPMEPVDLDEILASVRGDLRVKIEESAADLTVEKLPRVEGDGNQLHQLFQNLLENAIEYSGDEPPRVHVSAERHGDRWAVSVSDEGVGIDPEDVDRVFEVFQSLDTHDGDGGTGIGLALCQRIVERHGGDVRIDSEPGVGTTVTVTLPAAGDGDE